MKKSPLFRRTMLASVLGLLWQTAPVMAAPAVADATSNTWVLEAKTMDRKADPCRDFYEYANGEWLQSHPIPADRARYSAYDEVTERNLAALKQIAETAAAGQGKTAVEKLVGAFYASGMDETAIEQAGIKPLEPMLAQIQAIQNPEQLLAVIAAMHKQGVMPVFMFSVDQDAKNTSRYIPQMMQGGLGLPDRDYYLKSDAKTKAVRAKYLAYVAQLLTLAGESPAAAQQHANAVLGLETRLAKASLSKVALRDPQASYHLSDVQGLKKLNPATAWDAYFQGIGLPQPGQINLAQPGFLSEAARMMQSLPLDQWKTYLRWQLLNARAESLNSAFVNAHFDFYGRTMAGTKELRPRWKRVLADIDHFAGEALGELYVAQFFSPEAKAGVLDMVANIKQAMRDRISKLDWMSASTRQQAYRKLDTLVVKIGYPDRWRDYTALHIDNGAYAANTARAAEFEFQRILQRLGKPIDRNEWDMTPQTVNAYYNPTMNEMVFPAGILQPPLYHLSADAAANYGNTGATIGHELTHAFDDEGRQYDADGNLKSWWSKADEKKFLTRVKAIEQQFDEFNPIDQMHINGKLTAGENIADLGGLKIALQALHTALASKPQATEIDGLTPDQRFFVANAQSFRGVMRDERLRLQLATNPHAPEKYRVIGPLANMTEFADAFQCKGDRSSLRPIARRVNIW